MTASTLPGSIPGLLRRGSPVAHKHRRGVVVEDPAGCAYVLVWLECGENDELEPGESRCIPLADLHLDLSDPTGRVHAAWWWIEQIKAGVDVYAAVVAAGHTLPMIGWIDDVCANEGEHFAAALAAAILAVSEVTP